MNVINIMNFVRQIDERVENSEEILFNTTKKELALVRKYGYKCTFLLQYDVLLDEKYLNLFKDCDDNIEFGLWYEIVEPLTTKINIPYESEYNWKWDWHVKPGYPMSYPQNIRIKLIDEAMRKFKEIFGYYPKVVGSWVIDTYTFQHLVKNYQLDMIALCRDQFNTDAYNLIGGYYPAYYACKNNIFTPSNNNEQIDVPIFRLVGPCPIHNYDNEKYSKVFQNGCFTIEPVWECGSNPEYADWYFKTLFKNEHLGWSYAHVGQENCFGTRDFLPALEMQLEKIKDLKDVKILTMSETGRLFKKENKETPVSTLYASEDYDNSDTQSVNYNSKYYSINVFRYDDKISIRYLYLFDNNVLDHYYQDICTTFFATYENLPTIVSRDKDKNDYGLLLEEKAKPFLVNHLSKDDLSISWENGSIILKPNEIIINKNEVYLSKDYFQIKENKIIYKHNDYLYSLVIENAVIEELENKTRIRAKGNQIVIKFEL